MNRMYYFLLPSIFATVLLMPNGPLQAAEAEAQDPLVLCSSLFKFGDLEQVQEFQFSDNRSISLLVDEGQFAIVHVKAKPGAFNVPKAMAVQILDIRLTEDGYPKIFARLRHSGGSSRWLEDFEVASLAPVSLAKKYFTKQLLIPSTVARMVNINGTLK